jgi:hypothetical protein
MGALVGHLAPLTGKYDGTRSIDDTGDWRVIYRTERERIILVDIGTQVRIIGYPVLEEFTDKSRYEALRAHSVVKYFETELAKNITFTMVINEGIITVTDFGNMFMDAVLGKL